MVGMTAPSSPPPYRQPVARGQSYPPLGFADDGTPRYQYQPSNPAAALPVEPSAPPPPPPPEPPRRNSPRRTLLGIGAVLLMVLALAGALMLVSSRGSSNDLAQRYDPPVPPVADDPYLSEVPPLSTLPRQTPRSEVPPGPRVPGETGAPGNGVPRTPTGPPVPTIYEVTTDGQATVMYTDGARTRVDVTQGGTWTVSTTTNGVARVTVVLQRGAAASCSVTVDGKVVSRKELPANGSSIRLLTCQG